MINQKEYFTAGGSKQDFYFRIFTVYFDNSILCGRARMIKDLNWIFRGTSNVPRSRIKQIRIDRFISLIQNIQIKISSNNFQEQSQGLVMTAEMTT